MTSLENKSGFKVLLVDDSIDDREYFHDLIEEAEATDLSIDEVDNA